MPSPSAASDGSASARQTCRAAGGITLAASPTFALMAWIATKDAPAMALCSSGLTMLPIDGMAAMYLLMCLFHLSPWLKLGRCGRALNRQ